MIDLHSHILFGLDDGPQDLAGSVAFARSAVAAGTTTIVATPHADSHYAVSAERRDAALAELRPALEREGVALEVLGGAEVALDRYLDLDEDELERLRMGDGPYLLLECPLSPAAGAFDRFLATLLERGVRVVLAHPERCPAFQRHPDKLEVLVRAGAVGQVTSASLAGLFGRTVQRAALHMLEEGLVADLASDAHDPEHRAPDLQLGLDAAARELPGSAALADWLTVDVPRAVLDGAPIPPRPAVPAAPRRRRRFGLLR